MGVGVANKRIAVPNVQAAQIAGPSYLLEFRRSKEKNNISGVKAITIAISTIGHSERGRCTAAMPPITAMVASIAATIVMLKPEGSLCSLQRSHSCKRRFSASGIA
jgi:hypothetical protein